MGGPREVSPAVDFTFYEGIQLPGTVGARWGNHHPAKNSCPAWNSLSRDCLVLKRDWRHAVKRRQEHENSASVRFRSGPVRFGQFGFWKNQDFL